MIQLFSYSVIQLFSYRVLQLYHLSLDFIIFAPDFVILTYHFVISASDFVILASDFVIPEIAAQLSGILGVTLSIVRSRTLLKKLITKRKIVVEKDQSNEGKLLNKLYILHLRSQIKINQIAQN